MEALHALVQKNAESDICGFLQPTFLGSETQQMETYPRSELTEQISDIREIQNGSTRECWLHKIVELRKVQMALLKSNSYQFSNFHLLSSIFSLFFVIHSYMHTLM